MIRKSFALALIGGVALALSATAANAGWWHGGGGSYGSSGGSSGSYGSSGGSSGSWGGSSGGYASYSSYGSSGGWASSGGYAYAGSSGSYGGHRGLFAHKHRGWGGSSGGSSGYSSYYGGSSGGSSGGYGYSSYSYGSSGGSSGGYYSSGYGSSYGSQGGVIYSTPSNDSPIYTPPGGQGVPSGPTPPPVPVNPGVAPAAPAPPAAGTGASYNAVENGTAAIIYVNVPASAKVFVNGNATTSTGTARQYISRGLRAGQLYTYEFRLEAEVNGKLVTETKQIQVTGGQRAELAFNTPADAPVVGKNEKPAANKTTLILNVPADARVTLGGAETQQTGAVREFSTEKLNAGDKWENYTIRVEATIDGQVRVAEKTVTVNAGDYRELSFDLTATEVTRTASR
jgi:uncharacterized protein (TIGR03000 family)